MKIELSKVIEQLALIAMFNGLDLSKAKDYSKAVRLFKAQNN